MTYVLVIDESTFKKREGQPAGFWKTKWNYSQICKKKV